MKLIIENWRATIAESYIEDYTKHSALNIGQVLRHVRYLFDLPDHTRFEAAKKRAKWIVNDLMYAILPPDTHHTEEEIEELTGFTYAELIKMGYDPDYTPERPL